MLASERACTCIHVGSKLLKYSLLIEVDEGLLQSLTIPWLLVVHPIHMLCPDLLNQYVGLNYYWNHYAKRIK